MKSFLTSLKTRIEAVPLPPATKEILTQHNWPHVQEDLRAIQNQLASGLDKLEKKIRLDLEKSANQDKFLAVKKSIRTNLAKWLYLTSLRK